MGLVDLTPYNQPQGSTSDGTKFDNLIAAIQTAINGGIDSANFGAGKIFDPSKLMQNTAVDGDGLAYDSVAGIWKRTTDKPLRIAALAGYPADGTKALFGDGTWKVTGAATVGTELDYAQITAPTGSISATTEGTAVAVVTGNSITYDGTRVKVEFWCPGQNPAGAIGTLTFVLLCDARVVGHAQFSANGAGDSHAVKVEAFDTPSAGAHVYKTALYVNTSSTTVVAGTGGAGTNLPAFQRVTKA